MNTIEVMIIAKKEDAQFIAHLGRITFTETFGHFFRSKRFDRFYNFTFSASKNWMEFQHFLDRCFVNRLSNWCL